jgi:sec-independent protein translocase protein TatC
VTRMQSEASLTPAPTTNSHEPTPKTEDSLPTFLDHIHELRRRLFWVVAVVLIASAAAYSFLDNVIKILTAPLGDKQLYYLTPAGGLTFTFKLCTFIGFVVGVPVVMYQIYRFVEPLMGSKRKSALFYVGLSTFFAAAGVLFAYFVSLPAALHFLTNFDLGNIQAMLTVDSYLSFVITYLLGAALLFQIPLLLLIINTMTPLKPSKLMKLQRYVIVGAFILAAVISPTPDIMNQTFLALPIIGMYQLGVVLVWLRNMKVNRADAKETRVKKAVAPLVAKGETTGTIPTDVIEEVSQPSSLPVAVAAEPAPVAAPEPAIVVAQKPVAQPVRSRPQKFMMDIGPRTAPTQLAKPKRPEPRPIQPLAMPTRSIDGFMRAMPASGG